ncbi:DUF5671 domain-containing protein [Paracoccus sulfuroxidans]|uniref:DUF5671 domain-containing protein n=1 Tax=Paracoccus sulfuroxidans TaxID=384678 RepID=A0A562NY23_9RHOB|nr:DUF5671 domain-containing protein [Paracoccus sulfuroxidans]TWI37132.1 hypothetical protein IQ24_00923 [Paracoccus sulfuroxidans]
MRPAERLTEFVREALSKGQSRDQIADALGEAGWGHPMIRDALASWQQSPGLPPVPRAARYVSAREALVHGLLFLSLGTVICNLVSLGMTLIDNLIADPLDVYGYGYYGMTWPIASLIVFLPAFLFMNRYINRTAGPDGGRSLVRRWFAAITLLLALMTLLGDAVYTIYALLNGDLTLRFVVKALWVGLLAVLVLGYYRDEVND